MLELLRARLAELADLPALARLAAWDQRTMMPPEGAEPRAHVLATLSGSRTTARRPTTIGGWLDELDGDGDGLADVDRDLVRLARRDCERTPAVPADLAAELAQAVGRGPGGVADAPAAADDFAAFAPALRRNVELAREYAACFDDGEHPYDALLADYDFGLTAARVRELFDPLATALSAARRGGRRAAGRPAPDVPVDAQRAAVDAVLARLGVTADELAGRRLRRTRSPPGSGPSDTRITTRYEEDATLESVLAALHEYGHGLYERQIPAELGAHEPRPRHVDVRRTSPRASCGRTTSGATPRSLR